MSAEASAPAKTGYTPPAQCWTDLYKRTNATDPVLAKKYLVIFHCALGNTKEIVSYVAKQGDLKILTDAKIAKLDPAPYPFAGGTLLHVALHNKQAIIYKALKLKMPAALLELECEGKQRPDLMAKALNLAPVVVAAPDAARAPAAAGAGAAATSAVMAMVPTSKSTILPPTPAQLQRQVELQAMKRNGKVDLSGSIDMLLKKAQLVRHESDLKNRDHHRAHIEKSREIMLEGMKGLSGRLLVFGAGNLEPLERFGSFDEIIFVDNDQQALDAAKKRVSKATCHCLDLTGSVRTSLAAIADEVLKCKKTIPEGVRACIDVLDNCKSNLLKLEKLGKFDYVVSSLVAGQIAQNISSAMIDLFKTAFVTNLRENPEFMQALGKFIDFSFRKHVVDIVGLSKGKVYFSDTVARIVDNKPRELIPNRAWNNLKELFKVELEQQWNWVDNDPKTPFVVRAFLIKGEELADL
jgi:hypothetical protein